MTRAITPKPSYSSIRVHDPRRTVGPGTRNTMSTGSGDEPTPLPYPDIAQREVELEGVALFGVAGGDVVAAPGE